MPEPVAAKLQCIENEFVTLYGCQSMCTPSVYRLKGLWATGEWLDEMVDEIVDEMVDEIVDER